jgi:heat shock protein HslJ
MRRLLAIVITIGAFLVPSTALAANPPTQADREFMIQGLVYGSQKIEATGKLAILSGSNLVASVGCNTIGGSVTVDGDHVTVDGALTMTEMACPGVNGDTEAALVKILSLGSFTISDGGWFAEGGAILAVELPGANPGGPDQTPPDGTGVVEPSGAPVPLASCPPDQGTGSGSGGSVGSGGGSTGSGGGSNGSAGGSTGSAGSVGGSTGSGTTTGSTGAGGSDVTGSGSAPAATAVTVPAETPASAPGGGPGSGPDATSIDVPPASPIEVPPATPGTVPAPIGSVVAVPLPPIDGSPVPVDPGIEPVGPGVVPVPGATLPADCYAVPADALNAGGVPPAGAQSGSGVASDLVERTGAFDTATWPLLAIALVLLMAVVGIVGRAILGRSDLTRP